jgi:hypothetical protein
MRAVVLGILALLSGCTHTEVQDMSNGQHSLTATADSGGVAGSHEEAVEQANGYCARGGQQAVIGAFYDKAAVGVHGEHTSTIIFSCAAPRTLHF